MKIFLCLLLIKVCSCVDSEPQSNNYWREIAYDDGNYGYQQRGPIVRPCSLQDVNCIRHYFAQNSKCSPAYGPAPDPLRIKVIPQIIPHVNITFVLYENDVKGFNDFKIKEFYLNQKTDKLVLEVEFQKLFLYAPYSVISFHRKGEEPLELSDYAFIEFTDYDKLAVASGFTRYNSKIIPQEHKIGIKTILCANPEDLSLTLTAPYIRDINLSKGHVYTYISDVNPKYGMGPKYTESKDPQVQKSLELLIARFGLSLQEAFVTIGPIFMSVFLQNSICSY